MDLAGVLVEIGDGVDSDLRCGDHVMAIVAPTGSHGAYSEQVVVSSECVARVPAGATDVEACTLPMNGLTAQMAIDALGLDSGETLAVTGAAGAFGGYMVQLAAVAGLVVAADASEADERLVEDLGADVVLRRGDDFARRVRGQFPAGVHGAADGALLNRLLTPAVRDGGTIVTVRDFSEPNDRGVTFQRINVRLWPRDRAKLDRLRQLVEQGKISLRVAEVVPKEQAAEAHRRLEAGGVRGRMVIEF
jgi:NADPH:quinone reductase-like Zn-dependent oxidoreductase